MVLGVGVIVIVTMMVLVVVALFRMAGAQNRMAERLGNIQALMQSRLEMDLHQRQQGQG
jgi:Tfp pilus assembly protein PilX